MILRFILRILLIVFPFVFPAFLSAATTLVPTGSNWKYLDNGSDQGTDWRSPSFDDSSWKTGPAQLGYGDGDEATVVSYGGDSSRKHITTYFRHAFNVSNALIYTGITIRLVRDDGAVVYLNGIEIIRTNMPAGTITHTTDASATGSPENAFNTFSVPNTLLSGNNVLAVEIHQDGPSSSDISFDLELSADSAIALARGPYLQMGTPGSMTIRWRTNGVTDTHLRYGLSATNLDSTVSDLTPETDHEVQLTNLQPATKYYYSVGSSTSTLAGGDSSHYFITSPLPGAVQPTRVWVVGDSGTANSNARAVRDAYHGFNGSRHTNVWLMLGDNAYENGTDTEYQAAVFDMFSTTLRQTPLWPTLGNHDAFSADSSTQTGVYYNIFTLPKQGEAGGSSSGTEAYYSFDYGNIHFICLDSQDTDRSSSGAMLTWLRNDIAATDKDWVIAFWHHPPYSKGSHDSDIETRETQMRENVLPILEDAGVDLVLTGHSHSYERSYLIDGHYGTSSTFTSSMKKDGGSGREDDTGAYQKPAGLASHEGAVYAVAGSSGKISGGLLNHPVMFVSLNLLGSMVLDIDGNRLDAKFLDNAGLIQDYFTISKGGTAPSVPESSDNLSATAISSSRIDLQWSDNSSNESGFAIERSTDGINFQEVAEVTSGVTTYSNTGLSASTTYYYQVRSFNSAGSSEPSNVAGATTHTQTSGLAAPSNLQATAYSSTKINLTWTDNSGNESSFKIERSTDGINFTHLRTVASNVTSYLNTGLQVNTTYFYRVRAYISSSNSSPYSNNASAKTLQLPAAPSNLTAQATSTSRISVTWTDNSLDETGFRIQRSTDGVNFKDVKTASGNITNAIISGLSSRTKYYFRVRAYRTLNNSTDYSGYSNVASATTN